MITMQETQTGAEVSISSLDEKITPSAWWNRAYRESIGDNPLALSLSLSRPGGTVFSEQINIRETARDGHDPATFKYVERHIKFRLWQVGASEVRLDGPDWLRQELSSEYRTGQRAFDSEIIGEKVFGQRIEFLPRSAHENDNKQNDAFSIGGYSKGCRIGFDLGGSDRKAAAVMDGEVLFSEEIPWSPYFESDPEYHWKGILESVERAAAHLPRVDAIGGSAAGIYINSEPRVGSLFRGVSDADFQTRIRPIFERLGKHFGDVPVMVVNDGDATALSAAQSRNLSGILGIAMGTSMAVGYVDPRGSLTPWINELAFAPVDHDENAALDEWSGDRGCGVQYFSQQAIVRLLSVAGLKAEDGLSPAEILKWAQDLLEEGNPKVRGVFQTVGEYLAYSLVHYREYYDFQNVLLLGRVLSGEGGEIIKSVADTLLRTIDPVFHEELQFLNPTELEKRHGQAIAAASLVPDSLI